MCVRIVVKKKHLLPSSCPSVNTSVFSVCPSTRLFACISEAPTARISEKFHTEDFYENLPGKFQFWLKRDKNIEHVTWIPKYVFCCWRLKFDKNHFCATLSILCCCQLHVAQQHTEKALQQWLLEHVTISCYTYIAYIVRNYTSTGTLLVNFRMAAKTLRRPFLSASFPIRPTIDHTKS